MRLRTQLNPYLPSVLSAGKQETLPIRKETEVIQDGRQRPLGTAGTDLSFADSIHES